MSKDREIYIVLTDTGTILTKIIRQFTRDPLNHVSIALDLNLKEVYSFGRKIQSNPFIAGFVQEDVTGNLFRHSTCAIYRLQMSERCYRQVLETLHHFIRNEEKYRYNLLGLLTVPFNIEWDRKNFYFCSQFVASLLHNSGMSLFEKSPLLIKPGDFHYAELELVYQGSLKAYLGEQALVSPINQTFQTA